MKLNKQYHIFQYIKVALLVIAVVWLFLIYKKWLSVPDHAVSIAEFFHSYSNFFSTETGPFFIQNIITNIFLLVSGSLFILLTYGFGRYALLKFFRNNYEKMEIFIFSSALGFGIVGGMTFILAACQILYPACIFFILIPGLFLLNKSVEIQKIRTEPFRTCFSDVSSDFEKLLYLITISLCVLCLLSAFTPDLAEADTLNYYLAVPQWWLFNHGIKDMPHHIYHNLFSLYGCIYAAAMGFTNEFVPKMVNLYAAMTGTVAMLIYFCCKYFEKRLLPIALVIMCSTYQFCQMSFNTGSDSFCALFSLSALAAIMLHSQGNKKSLALAALLSGFSMAVKPTSLLMIFPAMFIIVYNGRKNMRKCLMELCIFVIIASIPVMPWLIKNYVLRGNPFFPFLTNIFGAGSEYDPMMIYFFKKSSYIYSGERYAVLKTFWNLFFSNDTPFNNKTSPLLLALAGFLPFIFKKGNKNMQVLLCFTLASLFLHLLSVSTTRYYFPIYLLLSLFFAYYLYPVLNKHHLIKIFFLALLFNPLIMSFYMFNHNHYRDIIIGLLNQNEYLKTVGYSDVALWINRSLPVSSKILIDDTGGRGFYILRNYYVTSFYDKDWYDIFVTGKDSPEDILYALKKEGITHILRNFDKYDYSEELKAYRAEKNNIKQNKLNSFKNKYLRKVFHSNAYVPTILYEIIY